jgi:cell division transport system permease protein
MKRHSGPRLAVALIVAAFTALAGLAGLAGLAAFERSEGWRARLAGEMTVAIRPTSPATSDAAAARAAEVLAGTDGVAEARALDPSRVSALLAPWTAGARGPDLAALPRLIAVDLDPRRPARRQDLAEALNAAGIDAVVDDHKGWRQSALEFQNRAAAPLIGALMLCVAGLAATGALAAGHEASRQASTLRTRLHLGETAASCLLSTGRATAPGLLGGVLAGGVAAGVLGVLSGLAGPGTSPAALAAPAGLLAGVTALAALVAMTCAFAMAARRIGELEP